jgi:hypothetical protein
MGAPMTAILDVRIPAMATELCPLRHEVAIALAQRSVAVSDADAFVSVVNELVTAAMIGGTGPLEVKVQLDEATARASVADVSPDDTLGTAFDTELALGVALLDHLAGAWGMSYDRGHAYLWAESPVVRERPGTVSFRDGDGNSLGSFLNPSPRGHPGAWRVR